MEDSNGNMYPGVKTWNPLGGECAHKCGYCSTNSMKKRYEAVRLKYSGPLKLYFDYPSKTDKIVFVCGQQDLFAENIPASWIKNILDRCKERDNNYLFQSKNPGRFMEFAEHFPVKSIFCTTIETNRRYDQMGETPATLTRAICMNEFIQEYRQPTWSYQVTIEPIMDFDLDEMVYLIETCLPDSVNIGADSKGSKLSEPTKNMILALIERLQKFTVIERKTNLTRLLK